MSTYAIGDIQGCYDELARLLELLKFDPAVDRLWLAGDLVNRGPKSLKTLRFVKSLGSAAVTVLGNHDLHLLATVHGIRKAKPADRSGRILRAKDLAELVDWLRQQPLIYHDKQLDFAMLHAGLPPQWSLGDAKRHAAEVEKELRSPDYVKVLANMYGDGPEKWSEKLSKWERYRYTINCLTRLRYCSRSGKPALQYSGAPGSQPGKLMPWFEHPARRSANKRIVFGHWSTLGITVQHNTWSLDAGCVWGGALAAMNLQTLEVHSVACPRQKTPG